MKEKKIKQRSDAKGRKRVRKGCVRERKREKLSRDAFHPCWDERFSGKVSSSKVSVRRIALLFSSEVMLDRSRRSFRVLGIKRCNERACV